MRKGRGWEGAGGSLACLCRGRGRGGLLLGPPDVCPPPPPGQAGVAKDGARVCGTGAGQVCGGGAVRFLRRTHPTPGGVPARPCFCLFSGMAGLRSCASYAIAVWCRDVSFHRRVARSFFYHPSKIKCPLIFYCHSFWQFAWVRFLNEGTEERRDGRTDSE